MNTTYKNIFEPELLDQIEQIGIVEINKGEIILKENAYIKHVPLVLEGNIKVRKIDESGKELVLYRIYPGESCILSITYCLNDKHSSAEAVTEAKTKLFVVPTLKVKEWMNTYKSWRDFIFNLYHLRLLELLTLLNSVSFLHTDTRLKDKLRNLQLLHGSDIPFTHQDLANEIGTAREVISRLLKQFENDGIIKLERGEIKIIRPL